MTSNGFLDRYLGELSRPMVPITQGATVAHLSFYLAQHLGCDPIILIGQDLGFSDGLYYCPGTAIHDVWAPELGQFNTLEMMEWQRIVRHRGHLQVLPDINGRPIYTDEQMTTYHKQFERRLQPRAQEVINATEGGLPLAHTTRKTLAERWRSTRRGRWCGCRSRRGSWTRGGWRGWRRWRSGGWRRRCRSARRASGRSRCLSR